MRLLIKLGGLGLLLAFSGLLVAPAGLLGQEASDDQAALTLKDVKDRLKQNKKYLEEAKKRGKAGDAPGLEVALTNYNRGIEGLDRAMSQGRFEGDASQHEDALDRVEQATRKHTEVLTDLLGKVPEQARPAIEHAIEVSQKGRTTALQNLEHVRNERMAAERRKAARRPTGLGQPGGFGRGASGSGRPGGVGGGPGGNPGGGPPAGNRGPR